MIANILAALAAVSTFAEPTTSPLGEVTGVYGNTLRVRISGVESSEAELRFALKNSNDEFAEFEELAELEELAEFEESEENEETEESENPGVYIVTDWKSEKTDKTVLTISDMDSFEITNLDPGDYTLIPLVTNFTAESSEFILVGAGEYPFSIISEDVLDNSDDTESSESSESSESLESLESSESVEVLDEPAVMNITYVEKKLALPETGGKGANGYYIVGGAIIAVSGAVLAARYKGRRK